METDGDGRSTMDGIAQKAKDDVLEAAEPMKEKAEELADRQKKASAARLDSLAQAVHGAADQVGKEQPQAAEIIHKGARQIEKASRTLSENSVGELAQLAN